MTMLEENTCRAIININQTLREMLTLFKAMAMCEREGENKNE